MGPVLPFSPTSWLGLPLGALLADRLVTGMGFNLGGWAGISEPSTHAGLGATLRTSWVPEWAGSSKLLAFLFLLTLGDLPSSCSAVLGPEGPLSEWGGYVILEGSLLPMRPSFSELPEPSALPLVLLASYVLGFHKKHADGNPVALRAAAKCGSWVVGPPKTPWCSEKFLLWAPMLLSHRGGQLHFPQFSWPMGHLLESSQPVLELPHSTQPCPAHVL
uniref:Uncharacterized protein n=1 Tax=Pipistrellus kuhlii TaxID=59472 RepID=A0A7J7YWW9_PIPKU|nr:hypothetical protein mPipKuh1_009851 [Pipistrellus kuhlii]